MTEEETFEAVAAQLGIGTEFKGRPLPVVRGCPSGGEYAEAAFYVDAAIAAGKEGRAAEVERLAQRLHDDRRGYYRAALVQAWRDVQHGRSLDDAIRSASGYTGWEPPPQTTRGHE